MFDHHECGYDLDFGTVNRAIELARRAHLGQTRWDGQTSVMVHLLSVANRVFAHGVYDTDAIVMAVLHDVVEDTPITLVAVADMFGRTVAEGIDLLTQRRGESRDAYLRRCLGSGDPFVLTVKAADRCDNVSGLHTVPNLPEYRDHVAQYAYELQTYFAPLADTGLVPETLIAELFGHIERAQRYFDDVGGDDNIIQFPRRPGAVS